MGNSFLKPRNKESRISKFMHFCNNIQELLATRDLFIGSRLDEATHVLDFCNYIQELLATREKSSDQDWMRLHTF